MTKRSFLRALLAFVILILAWHLFSLALDKPFLPTPYVSFAAFFGLLGAGELPVHFGISAFRVGISLILSFVLAVPLGLSMGQKPRLDGVLAPLVFLLYPLPKVVFLPVIVVLLGLGNAPKILLITLVVFFQILVVARDASRAVPQEDLWSIRSLNATPRQIYRHVLFPCCLPQILTSLRISLGTAIAVLFFAESFASTSGLGYFIMDAMSRRSYDHMFAGIIAMAVLGLLFYLLVNRSEAKFCGWKKFGG